MRLIAAGVAVVLFGAATARAQGGTITGVITGPARKLPPIRVTIDQKVCGQELPDEAIITDAQGHLANAVVVITGVKARTAPPDPLVVNEKCHFSPRVQIVRPNASVKTTSKDPSPMLHTTNAQDEKGTVLFNVALPFPSITIAKPVGGPGMVRVSCNTHPWMRAWMVVTDEMAGLTGADGRFTLTDVPPGTYELRIWHEALKTAPLKVTVVAGKTATLAASMK